MDVGTADVVVIIVNYGTAALALDSAASVLDQHEGGRVRTVYIVDNASKGDDALVLECTIAERGWSPTVTLWKSDRNLGFGSGNNLVMQQLAAEASPPRYAFLLNPDARLTNDAITVLAGFLDSHPAAVAAGCEIVDPDGRPVTAAFRFPGIVSTFASASAFGPISSALDAWNVSLPPDLPSQIVDWVAGAAVMLRVDSVAAAGFFDPAYFLYYEEVDLMRQLGRQGGEVWYVPEAQVTHIEGASTGVKSGRAKPRRLPEYWYASWRHYFVKNHGRAKALLAAAAWYLGAALNAAISALRGRTPEAPEHFYRDFWRTTVRPLVGLGPLPYD